MVWSMNVIATANSMATSARFFFARGALVPAPDSVMQLLPVCDGRWPPAFSHPQSPAPSGDHESERGSCGKPIDGGRIVAAW